MSASSAVPPATASTGRATGPPASPAPITTSAASAAATAAMAVVACSPAAGNWRASGCPASRASSHGALPSTHSPAISSSWAAVPGCPLLTRAPTARASLSVISSSAISGATPRRPAATASGSRPPSTSRSASGWTSSPANMAGSSPECVYAALNTVIQQMMNSAQPST